MRLSKRCEYGIKASVRLAQVRGTKFTQSRELAEAELLPAKFLESILLALRSASLLESKVGAGGGYRLARPADEVRVVDIVAALDRSEPEVSTDFDPRLGSPRPGQIAVDLIHERIDQAMSDAMSGLMLSDLVAMSDTKAAGYVGVGR